MLDRESMPLAAIEYRRGFDIDDLLLRSCTHLRSQGLRIGGAIQRSSGDRGQCAASVHVVDLRSGREFDIWEARGACVRGCRLDERGLIDVEPSIMAALADGVDLIVVNRFGRAESLGRGLFRCFTAALEASVPVLTAVRAQYDEAWLQFHGGLGRSLPPGIDRILEWCLTAAASTRATDKRTIMPASTEASMPMQPG
ncbi:MAG: DUF2478 domain-containing protein [Hyphomicrobiaceae bacterium]